MNIFHLGHEHPLSFTTVPAGFHQMDCRVCLRPLHDHEEAYLCPLCGLSYMIHRSCAHEMPQRIHHSFHRDHHLTPSLSIKFQCFSCKKIIHGVLSISFQCSICDFFLCTQCALKPDICDRNEGQNANLICHEQPMRFEEKKHEDGIECYACHFPCSGPTYTCNTCNYFFHNSCLELPPQISHPCHPSHPLRRHMASPGQSTITKCKACHRSCPFFIIFQCKECEFAICIDCTSLKPTIKHQDHIHSLCLMKETYKNSADRCDGYDTYCRKGAVINNEFMKYMLRCVECDFSLHLFCGRLPSSIKHECHVHLLALVDSLVEDDSDDYYCDICEEIRDPRICIYYCAECRYIAHLHCVVSKVCPSLFSF
ncbi:hypothetical protein UlMin_032438 [Ulmus minor]